MSDAEVHGGSETPAAPGAGLSARATGSNMLERQLGGDLPCVVCKYNLRGLSIRSVCPECGAAVRATILSLVDPHAAELEALPHPGRTAAGLVAWIAGALAALVLAWIPPPFGGGYHVWHVALVVCLGISGLGAMALVRPHAGVPASGTALAWIAVALYLPLMWLVWGVSMWMYTAGHSAVVPFVGRVMEMRAPVRDRILICMIVAGIAVLMRPNARLLVARSLALRTGRVDRQTILGIVAAATIAGAGELTMALARHGHGPWADTGRLAGQILIAAGWALVTIGLMGSLIDAVRIAQAIVMPAPTLGQVIADGAPERK